MGSDDVVLVDEKEVAQGRPPWLSALAQTTERLAAKFVFASEPAIDPLLEGGSQDQLDGGVASRTCPFSETFKYCLFMGGGDSSS